MPTIYLIRHAQGSFGGADYDVLSPTGHRQSAALGEALRRRGVRADRVVAGSLARQQDTARGCGAAADGALELDPRWDEYDAAAVLGHYSPVRAGLSGGEQERPMSAREFQALLDGALTGWAADGSDTPLEHSWPAFRDAAAGALDDVAASLGRGETAFVFTSGGVIGALCARLLGVPDEAFVAFNRVVVNTGVTKVIHGSSGSTLVSFNDHGHLEDGEPGLVTYR